MEDMLTNLETYGYIVLFLYSFGGGFIALMGAGVLSYTGHILPHCNSVGQKNNDKILNGIQPERGPCKTEVPKAWT